MRLGIFSDVHGNLVALERVLQDMKVHGPDLVVNLGDLATSPLWPKETVELLQSLNLPTVRGNHDRWLVSKSYEEMGASGKYTFDQLSEEQREFLGKLPATADFGASVLGAHGTPSDDTQYLLEEAVDGRLRYVTGAELERRLEGVSTELVLCGHSHVQHLARSRSGVIVLNPGSVGCPRYADNEDPFAAEACSPHARYALATKNRGQWSFEMHALEYDWSPVVERARANGREDWAAGFLA